MLRGSSFARTTLKFAGRSVQGDVSGCCSSGVVARMREGLGPSSSFTQISSRLMASESSLASTSYAPAVGFGRLRELAGIYKLLSKFRLSCLVVTTASAGFVAGSGEHVDWQKFGWTSLGTLCCAAAANTLNQVYEVANDTMMKRTARRPLPMGKLSKAHALAFAGVLGVGGVAILANQTNNLAAGLGAGNIVLYAAVYTPLKVVSMANTWVGALVGAVPPLLGWAAASGSLPPASAPLAAALYFWQLPHFLSLAYLCREDYARGGYRMLSLFDTAGRRTGACVLRNALYLLPLGLFATWLGVTSPAFAYEATIASGVFAMMGAAFWSKPGTASARLVFRASLVYLPAWMAAMLFHRIPQNPETQVTWEGLLVELQTLWQRHGWFLFHPLGYRGPADVDWEHVPNLKAGCPVKAMQSVSIAPFPFLPVPFGVPASARREAVEEEDDKLRHQAGSGVECRGVGPEQAR